MRIKLKQAVPAFLGLVTNYHGGFVVSRKAVEKLGENFRLNPIGTGPFQFEAYKPNESVTFIGPQGVFPRRAEDRPHRLPAAPGRFGARPRLLLGRARHRLRAPGPEMGRAHEEGEGRRGRRAAAGRARPPAPQHQDEAARRQARAPGDRPCDQPEADRQLQGRPHRRPAGLGRADRLSRHVAKPPMLPHDVNKAKALLKEAGFTGPRRREIGAVDPAVDAEHGADPAEPAQAGRARPAARGRRPPDLPRQHPQGPQRRDLLHGRALPGRRRAI